MGVRDRARTSILSVHLKNCHGTWMEIWKWSVVPKKTPDLLDMSPPSAQLLRPASPPSSSSASPSPTSRHVRQSSRESERLSGAAKTKKRFLSPK